MANFTKRAIKSSFMKLLNEQPLSKISVRDIVEDCGINRNSFYYHFQDIPSLIEEIIKEENKKAVMHIYNSANRDIYERSKMKVCEYIVTAYCDTVFGKNAVSEYDRASAIMFLKCELFGLSYEWIEKGMKDDAINDMYHIIEMTRGFSDEIIKRCNDKSSNEKI